MGLLDGLFNLTPEQSQGLMAASAKMLELSGPSRMPRSLGQIVGAAYGTYNDATAEAQQRAELKLQRELQQKLWNVKLKDAEADYTYQQGAREKEGRIAGKISKLYGGDEPGLGGGMPGGMPGAMPEGLGSLLGLGGQSSLGAVGALLGPAVQGLLGTQSGAAGVSSGQPSGEPSGPKLSDFNTSYNGTPYSQSEAGAAMAAAGGMNGYEPEKLNQVMALARQGMSAEQAGQMVFGRGGGQGPQGAPGAAPGGQAAGPKEFGVTDWLKFGMSPQQAMSMSKQRGTSASSNMTIKAAERMLAAADIYASENDFVNAEKRYKAAAALFPQVDRIGIATDPNTNQPVRVITYKNGHEEVSAFGAPRDMVDIDLGNVRKFVDRNQVQPGDEYTKGQSPDSQATDARWAARGVGRGGRGGAAGAEASLDSDTLDMMADQALRGDKSVFQNIGRGAQGSANLVALRGRITQKAKAMGMTGADLAAVTADYGGLVAGLRTSANISARVENAISEAKELAPLAITAGRDVARAGILPFGKAQVMFDTQTNDPALKKFAAANVGFVQAYAGAMARGQKPTVHDKEHAEKLISEATSQTAYEAVMKQLMLEMDAASRAPQKVREHLRGEIGGQGSGQGGHGGDKSGGSPQKQFDMLPPAAQYDGKRMQAANGTIYRSRGGKWVKE